MIVNFLKQYIASLNPIVLTKTLQVAQIFTFILIFITLIFTIYNVNRTQARNKANDIGKFKRDLNLKASDEMIEALNLVKQNYRELMGIGGIYKLFLADKISLESLHKYLEKCREDQHNTTFLLMAKFKQREIVLKKFEEEVDFFYGLGGEIILQLNILISWHSDKVGRTDPEINEVLRQIHSYSFETMDRLNKFQKNIQNEFLGKIYNGKL